MYGHGALLVGLVPVFYIFITFAHIGVQEQAQV
jgi:hypothetical protein